MPDSLHACCKFWDILSFNMIKIIVKVILKSVCNRHYNFKLETIINTNYLPLTEAPFVVASMVLSISDLKQ